jgi:hypothetical protein
MSIEKLNQAETGLGLLTKFNANADELDQAATKLEGIAEDATKNKSDTELEDRQNHSGTQSADTLTDGAAIKAFTAAERLKVAGSVPNTRTINGKALTGNVTLAKSDVGLTSADDTPDVDKPVSTKQKAALDLKADNTLTINGKALVTNPVLVKADVGLALADNTPDVSKPVSTAQRAAMDAIAAGSIGVNPTDSPSASINTYKPLVVGTYPNFGGLSASAAEFLTGDVQFIRSPAGTYTKKIVPNDLTIYVQKVNYNFGGTFPTVAAANLAITSTVVNGKNLRDGTRVDIGTNGAYAQFWWKGGFADINLVEYLADEISKKISTRNPTTPARIFDSSNGLYITDGSGNVMFIVDVAGAKSTGFNVIDPVTKSVVATLNKSWLDNNTTKLNAISKLSDIRPSYGTDGYYFSDAAGNLMAKITANGFQAAKFLDKAGNEIGAPAAQTKKLTGKTVVSLGDSHTNAPWLSQFCTDTGATYDTVLQTAILANQVNYSDSALMLSVAKALRQYATDNAKTVDVILIENCHFSAGGLITDFIPMNYENLQTYGTTYGSYTALQATNNTDRPAFIASLTPTLKTALRFKYATVKETITFTGPSALTAGTATLTIDGVNFALNVTSGMTLIAAVTALNNWGFDDSLPNWSNLTTKGLARPLSTIDLTYKGTSGSPAEPVITFDGGTSGMVMSTHALSSTTAFLDYYYNSLKLSDWSNMSKWVATNGTTAYPSMMGLIEYLQASFPAAEVIVWAVQSISVSQNKADANSFLVEKVAGSNTYYPDVNAYYAASDTIKYRAGQLAMKEVAERYSCRFLDVDTKCGISLINMFTGGYFFANNLHPTDLGYRQWGRTLAKLY